MSSKKSLIQNIVLEAQAYEKLEDITKLVESGASLTNIPLQPLYMAVASANVEEVTALLPKLSKEQRVALVGLDMWTRDVIDISGFNQWIQIYSRCEDDEIIKEFVDNEDFYLYLKSVANIWTFDVEDPLYPDEHDYYFLTDDNLLLVEYSEHYQYPNELKFFIRHLYDKHGVENAYTLLFKLVNDSFPELQETQYQENKERLRDYGFVDYYEARQALHEFVGEKSIRRFIEKKVGVSATIDSLSRNQTLHPSSLVNFSKDMDLISIELDKVTDEKRHHYLHFNFIRLINSTIAVNDALKKGRIELTKIGEKTRSTVKLGISYAQSVRDMDSPFDHFDFNDFYKIGISLIEIQKRKIKKALSTSPFEENEYEYFLGMWWGSFLENSYLEIPKAKNFGLGLHLQTIENVDVYEFWKKQVLCFKELVPFANSFFEMLKTLKEEGKVNDLFYMNYTVENIDFESILISSIINLSHGFYDDEKTINKMGLTVPELLTFIDRYFQKVQDEDHLLPLEDPKMQELVANFSKKFGFDTVSSFYSFVHGILSEHLNGYNYRSLGEDEFTHVGGPIILKNLQN
jgi:hypothetical protein